MSALSPSLPLHVRLRIDQDFLVRQCSQLKQVRQRRRSWDEFGEKVALDFLYPRNAGGRIPQESAEWRFAKELVHGVLASTDPQYDGIRKRLGARGATSTPLLLSMLSLWLAGILQISVSLTMPMTACLLYAIGEAGGDPEILR